MVSSRPHVVTLGGGRGHSRLLSALGRLECRVTAVTSVADDGGCSGKLRDELGMPPPGDLRRCLTTLATRRERAEWLETRTAGQRSVGNLIIAERYQRHGNIQRAIDELGWWLGVHDRVCPTSLVGSTIEATLAGGRRVIGESELAQSPGRVREMRVHAPSGPNPAAVAAIESADWVLLGPGSFYTSTLAAALSPGIREVLLDSSAPKLMIANVAAEDEKTLGFSAHDYLHELERHVQRQSGGRALGATLLGGYVASEAGETEHDPELLACALSSALGLAQSTARSSALSMTRRPGSSRRAESRSASAT